MDVQAIFLVTMHFRSNFHNKKFDCVKTELISIALKLCKQNKAFCKRLYIWKNNWIFWVNVLTDNDAVGTAYQKNKNSADYINLLHCLWLFLSWTKFNHFLDKMRWQGNRMNGARKRDARLLVKQIELLWLEKQERFGERLWRIWNY